jgi:hypothetical protein
MLIQHSRTLHLHSGILSLSIAQSNDMDNQVCAQFGDPCWDVRSAFSARAASSFLRHSHHISPIKDWSTHLTCQHYDSMNIMPLAHLMEQHS